MITRTLKEGQPCEHVTRSFENNALVLTACTVRHNDRANGAPKQLVTVKDGRTVRFICTEHAQHYKRGEAVYRRPRRSGPDPKQEKLL